MGIFNKTGSDNPNGGFFNGLKKLVGFGPKADSYLQVPVDHIRDNPYQPRTYILADPHDDLKISIAQYGVVVPLIVNRMRGIRGFTLVAGQRRLKAARELGLKTVPAVVRNLDQREMMEVTYLENLHRIDMTQVDIVKMFDRLFRKYPGLEEEELAAVMGIDPRKLEHARTLLALPIPALEALRAGMIDEDQARILAEIEDPDLMLDAIEVIYEKDLNLEQTRQTVNRFLGKPLSYLPIREGTNFHQSDDENEEIPCLEAEETGFTERVPCLTGR